MKRPPLLMRLRFRNGDKKFGLWLPFFLLMPLVLVLLIILSPLILIAILILWPSGWGKLALQVLGASWGLFCSMRGLKVDVQGRNDCVYISIV
jgi:hypothetical protein